MICWCWVCLFVEADHDCTELFWSLFLWKKRILDYFSNFDLKKELKHLGRKKINNSWSYSNSTTNIFYLLFSSLQSFCTSSWWTFAFLWTFIKTSKKNKFLLTIHCNYGNKSKAISHFLKKLWMVIWLMALRREKIQSSLSGTSFIIDLVTFDIHNSLLCFLFIFIFLLALLSQAFVLTKCLALSWFFFVCLSNIYREFFENLVLKYFIKHIEWMLHPTVFHFLQFFDSIRS